MPKPAQLQPLELDLSGPASLPEDIVRTTFGTDGLLAKASPRYKVREGQITTAYAIEGVMADGGIYAIEAPVGSGKSYAALVPAIKESKAGKKTVVVTAGIALQEQYIRDDLPFLHDKLPWSFSFALAKGLNNYVCMSNLEDAIDSVLIGNVKLDREEKHDWNEIVKWAARTQKGDISELPFEPKRLLPLFTTTSDECAGSKCGHYKDCHAINARRATREADIVVTNYHLFFADLVLKRQTPDGGVLPVYQHVVWDEAHLAASIASDCVGFRIAKGSVRWATRLLDYEQKESAKKGPMPVLDAELKKKIDEATDAFFARCTNYQKSKEYDIRLKRPRVLGSESLVDLLVTAVRVMGAKTRDELGITPERHAELQAAMSKCTSIAQHLVGVDELTSKDTWVYFLQPERELVSIQGKPVDVSTWMNETLWNNENSKIESVSMMSATLATKPGDFKYTLQQLGLDAETCNTLEVDSPFDIANQCQLVVPKMPDPKSPGFASALTFVMQEIVTITRGGVLGLFTSYKNLNYVYENLKTEYRVLRQGDMPKTRLIEEFRRDVDSVLLGTSSFWAGVDVPGEALRCVVIDKLPFPNVSDPVEDMLSSRHRDYFNRHSMPKAIREFRQGFGRLIRAVDDRGVVVCLDSRITDKSFGQQFLKSLPQGVKVQRTLDGMRAVFK